ncbi:SDR family NAD(P)-dependent oxidoreductase [Paenibacillus sp. LMG 31456]|uniref:SDR family NAD(P)-dependent oxidoreductase n=1 Tax=Paenibacillus foliorum TaxID=2654974 RepID=A0A972GUE8_9BACL|nr:SDR family oxidoreductase [Paenibacillus foliorum]NOU94679.1 SDR family NAD(P)-dependent oxidoreductase [Paenibacillus foliorum]
MEVTGHTILITGGASGIGLALAERFIHNDNQVIIVGRNENKLNRLKLQYPNITTYACNIGVEEQLNLLVKQLYDNHPELNILINNAGIQHNYSFMDTSNHSDRIAEEIAVNLISPIQLISKLLPLLARQKHAAIVNVSSGLGLVPKKSAPVYCSSKAGLHIFTKALRYQLENTNIKVFEIIPPVVDTDMTKGRGRNKISPDELAAQFLTYFQKDRLEVPIGKIKWLTFINRLYPALAEKILKNS